MNRETEDGDCDAATGTMATSSAPAGDRPRVIGFVNAQVQSSGITSSAYN